METAAVTRPRSRLSTGRATREPTPVPASSHLLQTLQRTAAAGRTFFFCALYRSRRRVRRPGLHTICPSVIASYPGYKWAVATLF
ncbi:hypothetical protein BaRGS_00012029 [Batillaria attramentaria]|uniref:Uncharacterized protein n=1 Tax=Batillaria attramentaria TaxID=370345 RepID=A0ABD0LAR2_9CAEN